MAEKIVERSAESMYVEDQAKYSIVANRRRAIPAVQDGLKPVQRRCLYGTFKKGFCKPSQHAKSAMVCGEVMGHYHAHGSCLEIGTKIKLLDGTTRTIGELYESGVDGVEILAVDPYSLQTVPAVAHDFRVGQYTNKMYHICFSNGSEIVCTNNHPFMLANGQWIKAEDIKPYTRLLTKHIVNNRPDGRESIDNQLIQDIVYNYYYGPIPAGYNKHHINFNCKDNRRSNFMCLDGSEHRLIHEQNLRSNFLDGLEAGRKSMFSEDSPMRYRIERKNSIMAKEFNKSQGIRKFKYAIKVLRENNLDVNEENYESLRGQIYNLPIISRLLNKIPECNSFEELVNYEIPIISELYNQIMSNVKPAVHFDYEEKVSEPRFKTISFKTVQVINNIIDNQLPYNPDSYRSCITEKTVLDDDTITTYLLYYSFIYPFVSNVYVEELPNEVPMFDFTVDGYENMIIPIATQNTDIYNIIGDVTPYISAHNSSIYESFVTMASWYKIKYPLIYGHGNFGNIMGAGAAAERYTELALSDFGYDIMIDELAKSGNIVDWMDTYTRSELEPEYLPAKLPNLLINGAFGIGVGMSINVPSHNLGEVVDATIALINNPKKEVVLIPDLIQECELIDTDWASISKTGRGTFKVRGKINTVTDKRGNVELDIVSLPDQINTTQVYEKILDMVAEKQLPMVKDVFNTLKDKKPNIRVLLKQGADPGYVKQAIYAKTAVQSTVGVNFEAVSMNGIDLRRYSYREYLLDFIDQRMSIKFRLYCNLLQQVMTRHLQVDAFVKVMQSKEFDKIMTMIRKYNGTDATPIIEFMIKNCKVSDIQAKFILNRTLPQLSKGHLKGYIDERNDLQKKIDVYMKYVTDDGTMIKSELIEDLKALKKKYNTPRLCTVIDGKHDEDIPKGIFKVVITERNYIRKIPDVDKVGIVRKDNPKFILKVDNAENILIFDNKGKVFNLPVHKIPITDRSGAGTDVRILIRNLTSDIAAVYYQPIFEHIAKSGSKHYLTILTKSNTIKKLDIEDFLNVSPSGLMYSKIRPEDEVVGVSLVPHNLDIAISSGHKVLRCKLKDIPLYKRNASGVKAMNTTDPINGLSVFYPNATDIVVVTKNGKFNRFSIAMLECNSKGKAGHKVIKLDTNDEILNVFGVNETDRINLLTSEGIEEVNVSDIKVKSSIAAGTKMVKSKGIIVRADVIR